MLSTLALYPIAVALSCPSNKSPMRVTFNEPNEAAPIPCNKRNTKSRSKLLEKKQEIPPIPNRSKEGIRIFFLPNLSAKIPSRGVRITPGNVKTVIKSPTFSAEILRLFSISGKAGVMLATPRTATKVMLKITWRFLLR